MILIIEDLPKALLDSGLNYRPQFANVHNKYDMDIEINNLQRVIEGCPKEHIHCRLLTICPITVSKTHKYYINYRATLFI